MKMRWFGLCLAACVGMMSGERGQAATVAQWNFNSSIPDANTATGVSTPSIGVGTATLVGGPAGAFGNGDANGGSSDPATGDDSGWQTTGYPAAAVGNETAGVQFALSTVGYQNIKLSYDLRHSNTSSRYEALQYSLDGTTFTTAAYFDGPAGDTWFNGRTADLSAIPGANNNPNFAFRIVAAFASSATGGVGPTSYIASNATGAYAGTGTWRFDMATATGDPVPEPASVAVAGLAGLALLAVRRKR